MANVVAKWSAKRLQRPWQVGMRVQHFAEDQALQDRNRAAKETGASLKYVFRSQYLPEQGMFCALPSDLQLGQHLPDALVSITCTRFSFYCQLCSA